MPYQIILSQEAETHLQLLTVRDQRIVIDAIGEQLPYQANVPTQNRQPMRPNDIATWKLRIGNLREYVRYRRIRANCPNSGNWSQRT